MTQIGTPLTPNATRLVLLGAGELGREVAIEAIRLGCEVVAVDRYANAPAMQVAQRSHVIDMTSPSELRSTLAAERELPCGSLVVVPEIEAIATRELEMLEAEGIRVIPTARATRLTMDREGIRRLAAEELGLPTSSFRFCESATEVEAAAAELGLPCVLKPVMSSSGKGQTVIRELGETAQAFELAQSAGRSGRGHVIVEGLVEFDYEITLLTVRHAAGTSFCAPIGHHQEDGDYHESWQPQPMSELAHTRAHEIAQTVTDALGGEGIFGVELFIRGDDVLFSEVSPRPHDTGMVTLVTQALSEFALHVRAVLGLPVPAGEIPLLSPGASCAIRSEEAVERPSYHGVADALALDPAIDLRIFGKPTASPGRRMGVALATSTNPNSARELAREATQRVKVVPS